MGCSPVIYLSHAYEFNNPAFTEKFYSHNHTFLNSNLLNWYVDFPWTSLLDSGDSLSDQQIIEYQKVLSSYNGKKHTICQHINWKSLLSIWERLGIDNIYVSHLDKMTNSVDKLSLFPFPLVATNYENKYRSENLVFKSYASKEYLASFIGCYREKDYLNNIREKLKDLVKEEKDIVYKLNDKWFYDQVYYDKEIKKIELPLEIFEDYNNRTKEYNRILSDSVFSFCPCGTGPNTIRLWESLSVGTIPVIFGDSWISPQCPDLSWSDFAVIIEEKEINDTVNILRSIPKDKILKMQINTINAYKFFRQMTCFV